MLFGIYTGRVHLFPSFVNRLRAEGHQVECGCVDAAKMKEYTIASAENLHRLQFKGVKGPPEFDKHAVDLSGIVGGRRYIAWYSFVSNVAQHQSHVLKECNAETIFSSSMTP